MIFIIIMIIVVIILMIPIIVITIIVIMILAMILINNGKSFKWKSILKGGPDVEAEASRRASATKRGRGYC